MKHRLVLLSAVALFAGGIFQSTASAEFIYRGPQHHDHNQRYWVNDHVSHRHGHAITVPGHWVWLK